jgi:hypothetical protein
MVLRGISNTLTEEKVSLPSIHLILLFILSIQLGPKRRSTSLFRRFNSILLLYGVINTLNVLIDTILAVLIGGMLSSWLVAVPSL